VPAEEVPAEEPAEKKTRRRPLRGQVLVAAGAFVAVLAVASAGFAVGRTTADDGDRPDWPGYGKGFDHGGPGGGPGMMPPGLPRDDD
jgi:hypothetical protein